MPFKIFFLPSYERCLKKLGSREKHAAGLVILGLKSYLESEFPIRNQPYVFESGGRNYRLVFKKLRGQIWEAYAEAQVRVLTRLEEDTHFLVFVGNHDQVRQFLKRN